MQLRFRQHRHEEHDDRELLLLILDFLEDIDCKVTALLPHPPLTPNLVGGYITLEGENMTDISVPAGTSTVKAVATFTDADGNVGVPASPPVWAVSDDTLASVNPDPSDPSGQTADVSLVASDSGVAVAVTSTATNADGTADVLTATITVEAAVPPPVDLVGGGIDFTVGA